MIEKTYKYKAKCDLCGKEEIFETSQESFWPDGWFELRNNGNKVMLSMNDGHAEPCFVEPLHFCSRCYDKLFGHHGTAWKNDDDDEQYVGLTD